MKRNPYRVPVFIAQLALLAIFMAAPASVMSATIHIATLEQLQKIGVDASYPLSGYYVLDGDIDASATKTLNDDGHGGYYGFAPIGENSAAAFSGSLDGQGYAIQNLYINRGDSDYVGLFGYVSGELATISNVALVDAHITGGRFTGALVGHNDNGLIKKCYSTGSVDGTEYVGGLVGRSHAGPPISNCYSTSAVSGNGGVGGLLGYNKNTAISTCYSAGKVSGGESRVGGLIGYSLLATAADCFWDSEASGQKTSAAGIAKPTADMKKRSTFADAKWDFTSVWGVVESLSYPFFRGANDPPQAMPDSYNVKKNVALAIEPPGVLANDSDADGDPLTAILVTSPAHGSLSFKTDGSFTYTPEEGFSATDSFTYKAQAGGDNTTAAKVTLVIGNSAPVAAADTYTTYANLPLYVPLPGVLGNDSDPNGDTLTAELGEGPAHGELIWYKDGRFSYYPDKDFAGTDSFTYSAYDGTLYSASAVVTMNVDPICALQSLYGEDSPEVETVRRYRDEVLATTAAGRLGIKLYYRMSPLLAGALENSESMQRMARNSISRALPWIRERLPEGR